MKIGDKVKAIVFRQYNGHEATIHGEIVAISEDKKVIKVSYDSDRFIDFYDTDFGKTVFVQDKELNTVEEWREENKSLKLMLSVILESHKKGNSTLNISIIKKIRELLE